MEIINKTYRDNGAIGALLDEYEKAINELKVLIQDVTVDQLVQIVDAETKDEDCRSIQTILTHVVKAGYTYSIMVRNSKGEELAFSERKQLDTIKEYLSAIDEMFAYNVEVFQSYPNIKMEEHEEEKKMKARWGQTFDVDQLMEHAIVHILRHRRQIERFMVRMN